MAGSVVVSLPVTISGNNVPVTWTMTVALYAPGDTTPRVQGSSSVTWNAKENVQKVLSVGIADLLVNGGTSMTGTVTITGPAGMPGLPSAPIGISGTVPIGAGTATLGSLTATFGAAYARPGAHSKSTHSVRMVMV